MKTIRLQVNDKVFEKVLWLLRHFRRDEVEIIPDETESEEARRYVEAELKKIDEGKETFLSLDELSDNLKQMIASCED